MYNYLKTTILLAGMTALFIGAGYMLGGESGMITALVFALVTNFFSYWYSDKILLKMYGAEEVSSGGIYGIVRELAHNADMEMPKLYIINSPQPNAFATGRNPSNGAVAVTSGILEMLTKEELRGVIAHELAHIKNRDTLIMTITATIAGALSMLANFAMFFRGARDNRGNILATLVVIILAPLAATLVQMAISRTREYAADRIGAEICGNPLALASALRKIDYAARRVDNLVAEENPATAHMFIVNPLHLRRMDSLFSTHPNTENRIRALEEMHMDMENRKASDKKRMPWG